MPKEYTHRVPVPGLTHSAVPAFPDVDKFQSRELLNNLFQQKRISKAELEKVGDDAGLCSAEEKLLLVPQSL